MSVPNDSLRMATSTRDSVHTKEHVKEHVKEHRRGHSKRKSTHSHSQISVENLSSVKSSSSGWSTCRPCKEHSFLTDVADVRSMEQGLLGLLEDFHSGKLRAFGERSNFEKMDQIREHQEKLARLHFELDIQQDMHRINSDAARTIANENLARLINQLNGLGASMLYRQMALTEKT